MNERFQKPPSLADAQDAGFPVGGEPLAVDLADTVVTAGPEPVDLLVDDLASQRFWSLHSTLLPDGWSPPDLASTRQLRDTLRGLLDAAQQRRPLPQDELASLNAFSERTSLSLSLTRASERLERQDRWHAQNPADLALSAVARSAIELLADPKQLARLRRCASSTCSMLFVYGDQRRRFCTTNICGNRERVARHYRRHRGASNEDELQGE
jgi:predicted RNA-binding Zn ribbon-like protein